MLPARFDYHRPDTLDEALELMDRYGDEAKVLAGGMSLIPLMKLRFASPANVVDINAVEELAGLTETEDGLRVKAVTRNSELETSQLLRKRYLAMAAAAPLISDPIVRNRWGWTWGVCRGTRSGWPCWPSSSKSKPRGVMRGPPELLPCRPCTRQWIPSAA